jgi:hypothetical protein
MARLGRIAIGGYEHVGGRPSAGRKSSSSIDGRISDSLPLCSGHGAKFALAIGDEFAGLAIDLAYEVEPLFHLSRYPRFAREDAAAPISNHRRRRA